MKNKILRATFFLLFGMGNIGYAQNANWQDWAHTLYYNITSPATTYYEFPDLLPMWIGGTQGYTPDPTAAAPQYVYYYTYNENGSNSLATTPFEINNIVLSNAYAYSGANTPSQTNLKTKIRLKRKPLFNDNLSTTSFILKVFQAATPGTDYDIEEVYIKPVKFEWDPLKTPYLDTLISKDTALNIHKFTKFSDNAPFMIAGTPYDLAIPNYPVNAKVNLTINGTAITENTYFNLLNAPFGSGTLSISGQFLNGLSTINKNYFVDMVGNTIIVDNAMVPLYDSITFTSGVQCIGTDNVAWASHTGIPPFGLYANFKTGAFSTTSMAKLAYNTPGTKYIRLNLSNSVGTKSIYRTVEVLPFAFINTASLDNLCDSFVNLKNFVYNDGSNYSTYKFYVDNILIPNGQLLADTLNYGQHTVKIQHNTYTQISKTRTFNYNKPSGDFTATGLLYPNLFLVDDNVTFAANYMGAASYDWIFEGQSDTGAIVLHAFNTGGSKNITLTTTSTQGCSRIRNKTINVINFGFQNTATLTNLCASGPTVDVAQYIRDYAPDISIYLDNVIMSTTSISMATLTYGIHTLKIQRTISGQPITREISFMNNTPAGNITMNITNVVVGDAVQFSASSITGGSTYQWTFPNGNSSTIQSPTYVFDAPGTQTVSVDVTTASGCTKTFTMSVNVINFGFQNTATLEHLCTSDTTLSLIPYIRNYANDVSIYIDNVILVGSTLNLNTLSYGNHQIRVERFINGTIVSKTLTFKNEAPSGYIATAPQTVITDDTFSLNANNIIGAVGYAWTINNANVSNSPQFNYSMEQSGPQTITLAATSVENCTKTFIKTINVIPFGFLNKNELLSICTNDSVIDLRPYIREYSNAINIFLDGEGLSSPFLDIDHLSFGNHNLRIEKVINNNNVSRNFDFFHDKPSGNFVMSSQSITVGDRVKFNVEEVEGATSYLWLFPKNISSTSIEDVYYTFDEKGEKTIKLNLISEGGCTRTIIKKVIVLEKEEPVSDAVYDILPNPMTDNADIVIDFGREKSEVMVQLYSAANRVVYNKTYSGIGKKKESVSFAHLAPGQYYTARFIVNGKVIKSINLQKQ